MSTSLHKIKNRRKHRKASKPEETLAHLLKDQRKKARFILLSGGVVLVSVGLFLSWKKPQSSVPTQITVSEFADAISFSTEPVKVDEAFLRPTIKPKEKKLPPSRILISDLAIDLPVKEAKVVKGYWEVFPDVAGFGLGSAYPGEEGNQVIFAHAREKLFLPLKDAKLGQQVIVFTADKWYSYTISDIKEVTPKQVEVIAPTTDSTLTLYTCSGFADSKRLIVTAKKS